jgi:microcystin-dependent protein
LELAIRPHSQKEALFMSEPFLSEIKMVGFNFAPRGWGFCDGQILPINQNQSLFALLGTTYGGDGRTSFGLPDLRGRAPMHKNASHVQGQRAGEENVSLTEAQMPSHTHDAKATSAAAESTDPGGRLLGEIVPGPFSTSAYGDLTNAVDLIPSALGDTGTDQGHNNMQPYLVLNFCIALQGLFPSRN